MNLPQYSGPNRLGICICGHKYNDHHLCFVMNQDYFNDTNEAYLPQECEFYSFNEGGGLDEVGNSHCHTYIDSMVPNAQVQWERDIEDHKVYR